MLLAAVFLLLLCACRFGRIVLGACPRQNQLGVAARAAVAYRLVVPTRARLDAWERAGLLDGDGEDGSPVDRR